MRHLKPKLFKVTFKHPADYQIRYIAAMDMQSAMDILQEELDSIGGLSVQDRAISSIELFADDVLLPW